MVTLGLRASVSALALLSSAAWAQSTIDPSLPASGQPYTSAPIRNNFQAAVNDINDLYSQLDALTAANVQHVANNSALKLLTGVSGMAVIRDGFSAARDGGWGYYTWVETNCVSPDDGAFVQPTNQTGCWAADFSVFRPNPKVWGAVGDGSTDDTTAVQAAVTSRANTTLWLGPYKYKLTSGLSSTSPITIIGENGNQNVYSASCVSGFVVRSDITALTLAGATATLRGVCFDMGANAGDRAAGSAFVVGNASINTGHQVFEDLTIINPYRGVDVGVATTGATQTNGPSFARITIINPVAEGIAQGRLSSGNSTVDVRYADIAIACFATFAGTANPNAIGFGLYDGAVSRFVGNSPYGCAYGTKVAPGTANGAAQEVIGNFSDPYGDSSKTKDLLVDTSSALGVARYMNFSRGWASAVKTTDQNIAVQNTGNGSVHDIIFSNLIAHGTLGNSNPIIDLRDNVTAVTIQGSTICADAAGADNIGIRIGNAVGHINMNNNRFFGCTGTLAKGIQILGGGAGTGIFQIVGNDFGELLTDAIDWTPMEESAVVSGNLGISNVCPNVTSAATITVPVTTECIHLTGVVTVTAIENSAWSNRRFFVYADDGLDFNTGGGSRPICSNLTLAAGATAIFTWNQGGACWAHTP